MPLKFSVYKISNTTGVCRCLILSSFLLFCALTTVAQEESEDDFREDFIGERILVNHVHSSFIEKLNLSIDLPNGHKLFQHPQSAVKLFTENGPVETFALTKPSQTFLVYKEILDSPLYAEVDLYYCREGKESLCIIKHILYEITMDQDLPAHDLNLRYSLSPANVK